MDYAVIIGGAYDFLQQVYTTTYFVEWVLMNIFSVPRQNIAYLVDTSYPNLIPSFIDYDASANKTNVPYYISQWLAGKSDARNVFIYILSHGGGFTVSSGELNGGRWDEENDENDGHEHLVNGTWRDVDEGIMLQTDNSTYWDDEFRQDISSLNSSLTVVLQTCKSANDTVSGLSCYSGGFIGDLSGPYRTVITSSNETGVSWISGAVAEFTYCLMNAFSNYTIRYDYGSSPQFDFSRPVNWSYKSWRGAFEYALQNDPFYLKDPNYQEFPWFDDDGNGLPGWINNTQTLDFPVNQGDLMRWLQHDINYDGFVNMKDIAIVAKAIWTIPGDDFWNRQADVYPCEDWVIDMKDLGAVSRDFGKIT